MTDRRLQPLWVDLAVAVLAPFLAILPARHAELPDERRTAVRWALLIGTVAWLSVLAWAVV